MAKISGYRDAALSFLILLGLAVPFLPLPHEHLTRIAVQFRDPDGRPRNFTTRTTTTICQVLAVAMSYDDGDGSYRRIDCDRLEPTDQGSFDD